MDRMSTATPAPEPLIPPLKPIRVVGTTVGTWAITALFAAVLAYSFTVGEEYWIGGAIGLGIALIDAIVTGRWFAAVLPGDQPARKLMRLLLIGFLVRLIVIVLGWVVLMREHLGEQAFVFAFFGAHLSLIMTLVWMGNNWLNDRIAARGDLAKTTGAESPDSAGGASATDDGASVPADGAKHEAAAPDTNS